MLAISLLAIFANVKAVEPLCATLVSHSPQCNRYAFQPCSNALNQPTPPTPMPHDKIEKLFEDFNGLMGGRFNQQYQDAEDDVKNKLEDAHARCVINPIEDHKDGKISLEARLEIEKGHAPAVHQILKEHADRIAAIQKSHDENDRKEQDDAIKTFCSKICWVSTDQLGWPMMGFKIRSSRDDQYSDTAFDLTNKMGNIYGLNFWERCHENNLNKLNN